MSDHQLQSKSSFLNKSIIFLLSAAVVIVLAGNIVVAQLSKNPVEKQTGADLSALVAESDALEKSFELFSGDPQKKQVALEWIDDNNRTDMIAPLIYGLRYLRFDRGELQSVLGRLTGAVVDGNDWFNWMLWQQGRPDIKPFDQFDAFLSELFSRIDPNFTTFIYPGVEHSIRLEEITWGGVVKDGIPALTNPSLVDAGEATYLNDNDLVFGVEINGDVRAYPYRIMDWHEMFNDVVGGVPVSLAYCTLCGSGILFDTRVDGRAEPFVFGSSGFLYRSNKLMYDQQTQSLWNQFTGKPVVGELTDTGIELNVLPVATTTWAEWLKIHPDTKVLSLDTGFVRDYRPGRPYGTYFASPDLMFPARADDRRLNPKDRVFGLRMTGAEKSWPLSSFEDGRVIMDRVGVIDLVLVGDEATRTVRAYRAEGRQFEKAGDDLREIQEVGGDASLWQVTETALVNASGETLTRLPGHIAFWFAWSGYLGQAPLFE